MVARMGGCLVALMVGVGLSGCRHFNQRATYPPPARMPIYPGPTVGTALLPLQPGSCHNGPSQRGPVVPQPQGPGFGPPNGQPLPQGMPSQSFSPTWEPSIKLQAPEPATDPAPNGYPRLFGPEPEPGQPGLVQPPKGPEPNGPPPSRKPDPFPDRPPVSPLPVGIPGFAEVRKGISNGQRPNSIDGFDWLAGSGYRTALHIHEPGQDDSSDRKLFESRGIRFISLEVSPDNLTPEMVERFNRVMADLAGQPLFVYDRDGMLSGGLWYLHFRLVENVGDQEALERAARLGLRTDPTGGHQRMLLAIQKYLANNGK